MKRSIVPIALLALVMPLLAAGCASTNVIPWTGLKISEAVSEFGRPTMTIPAKNGTVYVWQQKRDSLARMTASLEDEMPGPGSWRYLRWVFLADGGGRITFWSLQESRSPALFGSPVICDR